MRAPRLPTSRRSTSCAASSRGPATARPRSTTACPTPPSPRRWPTAPSPCPGRRTACATACRPRSTWRWTNGHVAVANLSRGALPALRQRYANVAVVEITADPEILAARLAGRGRESREEVLARLARTISCETTGSAIAIDNSGAPEIAGDKLVGIIRKAMAFADMSGTV